jgi:hypothetical protein
MATYRKRYSRSGTGAATTRKPKIGVKKVFRPQSPPWQFVMATVPFEGLRDLKDSGKLFWSKIARALQAYQTGSLPLGEPHANSVRLFSCYGLVPNLPLCAMFFVRRNGTFTSPEDGWSPPELRAACTTAGVWKTAPQLPDLKKISSDQHQGVQHE